MGGSPSDFYFGAISTTCANAIYLGIGDWTLEQKPELQLAELQLVIGHGANRYSALAYTLFS